MNIALKDLGFDPFFEAQGISLDFPDGAMARVIAEYKEAYRVKGVDGEYLARITGKRRFEAARREDFPAVGDWVVITKVDHENAVIQRILPRRTVLLKKYSDKQDGQIIATNIDVAFLVESLDRDFNLNRFERYLVLVREGGIQPILLLNKIDLVSRAEFMMAVERLRDRFGGIQVMSTSVKTEEGINDLVQFMIRGKTYCFLGSSGVGKSSLINKLLKLETIKTGAVSQATGKGKHTTTAREMYFLESGSMVVDNPGTREVGIAEAQAGIEEVFRDIRLLSERCKFADCTHTHEPGCEVLKAVNDQTFSGEKYENYVKLKKENDFFKMTDVERMKKDRRFGRMVKKSLGHLKEIKSKY